MRLRSWLSFVALITLLWGGAASPSTSWAARGALPPAEQGDGSLLFIENVGQFDPRARFQIQGGLGTVWLAEDALWVVLTDLTSHPARLRRATLPPLPSGRGRRVGDEGEGVALRISFPDANPHPRLEPFAPQDIIVNDYRGNDPAQWHTRIPVWGGVRYVDLYPGVDLEMWGERGRWAWRFVSHGPQFDMTDVRLRVEGGQSVTLEGNALSVHTSLGDVTFPLPALTEGGSTGTPAVARVGDRAFEVTSPYAPIAPNGAVAAQTTYPEEAYFGTYLGGSDNDWPYGLAVSGEGDILDRGDDSRAIWVVGWTTSTDFPTEPGPSSLNGSSDAFVTKMKRDAVYVRPVYSAYLGGSDQDAAVSVATDAAGNAYIVGWTKSADFPTTANAFDPTYNGCADGFVIKMDGDGSLLYATYLGGSHVTIPGLGDECGDDEARNIAVKDGVAYITGVTESEDFPTTVGAYDRTYANVDVGLNADVFVVKLNPAGNGSADLLYSTFVGGGFPEYGNDIAVDAGGSVYVTGYTGELSGPSIASDFPTTDGALDPQAQGNDVEAFVFRLNPAGNGSADLLYSTFLGGSDVERGQGIAVDAAGRIYVSGYTESPNFPTTAGAYDTTCGTDGNCNSRSDAFVSRIDPAGHGSADLLYSTFVGGNYWEGFFYSVIDIALDAQGDVYVTGETGSDSGFPITADAYDSTPDASSGDAFLVRLRPQGKGAEDLIYGTFVGHSGTEAPETKGDAIVLDEEGRVYALGENRYGNFPTTDHALYKNALGQSDVYIFRLLAPPAPDLSHSTKEVNPATASVGEIVTFTVHLVNSGVISAAVTFTDTLPASLLLQGTPAASAGPTPTVSGQTLTWSGTVTEESTVLITYTTLLTSTTVTTPTAVNHALIDDGLGNIYLRRAFVNGYHLYLPLVMRNE